MRRMPRLPGEWRVLIPRLRKTVTVLPPDVAPMLMMHLLLQCLWSEHLGCGCILTLVVKQPEGLNTVDRIFFYVCDLLQTVDLMIDKLGIFECLDLPLRGAVGRSGTSGITLFVLTGRCCEDSRLIRAWCCHQRDKQG